jgi:hypothetical protein
MNSEPYLDWRFFGILSGIFLDFWSQKRDDIIRKIGTYLFVFLKSGTAGDQKDLVNPGRSL